MIHLCSNCPSVFTVWISDKTWLHTMIYKFPDICTQTLRGCICTHSFMFFVSAHQGRTRNEEFLILLANTKCIKLFFVLDINTIKPVPDFFAYHIYIYIYEYFRISHFRYIQQNAEGIFFPFAFRCVLWFGPVIHDTTSCIHKWILVL